MGPPREKNTALNRERERSVSMGQIREPDEDAKLVPPVKDPAAEFEKEHERSRLYKQIEKRMYHEKLEELLKKSVDKNVAVMQKKSSKVRRVLTTKRPSFQIFKKNSRVGSNYTKPLSRDTFNIFGESKESLHNMITSWVQELHLDGVFDNDDETFNKLVVTLQDSYYNNPFHNWEHAFSVAQTAVMFIEHANLDEVLGLTPMETLALIIGCLGHDIQHPGNDNVFQIASEAEIAALYRHQSVLEHHHATQLTKIISSDACNIFRHYSPQKQFEAQTLLIDLVLATDLALHKTHIENLKATETFTSSRSGHVKDPKKRLDLLRAVVHACDLSGQTMSLAVAQRWEERISAEMDKQASEMENKGLPIPGYLEDLKDPRKRARHQIAFLDGNVVPLWKEIARVFDGMKPLYDNLVNVVREYYIILIQKGELNAKRFADLHFNHEKGGDFL